MSKADFNLETDLLSRDESALREPSLYKVMLLNDDFTPMDFVVDLLMDFFAKSAEEATRIMLNVHHQGVGLCGIYTLEIAETKVTQVNQHARNHGHPLKCTMERN
ncbi:MAG: ATP-dependent Clp protease adapter ClpS [Magnetococcales bacterium]|nr:ATP-dependent Clp protease adapter ClpS [Magnetococcales bacterium]